MGLSFGSRKFGLLSTMYRCLGGRNERRSLLQDKAAWITVTRQKTVFVEYAIKELSIQVFTQREGVAGERNWELNSLGRPCFSL